MDTVLAGKGEPVAILNRNTPAFYCVPADLYETMMEQLDLASTSHEYHVVFLLQNSSHQLQ